MTLLGLALGASIGNTRAPTSKSDDLSPNAPIKKNAGTGKSATLSSKSLPAEPVSNTQYVMGHREDGTWGWVRSDDEYVLGQRADKTFGMVKITDQYVLGEKADKKFGRVKITDQYVLGHDADGGWGRVKITDQYVLGQKKDMSPGLVKAGPREYLKGYLEN